MAVLQVISWDTEISFLSDAEDVVPVFKSELCTENSYFQPLYPSAPT